MIKTIIHADQMKGRLPSHLDGAGQLLTLLDKIGAETQSLETALQDLLSKRALDIATGKQLDGIGQIVDLARVVGQSDATYRALLQTRVLSFAKSGEVESVIFVYGDRVGFPVVYDELQPAAFQITGFDDADPQDPIVDAATRAVMQAAKAGGVEMILILAPATEEFTFSQASEADGSGNGPIDALHGFGDAVLTEGGKLARVV